MKTRRLGLGLFLCLLFLLILISPVSAEEEPIFTVPAGTKVIPANAYADSKAIQENILLLLPEGVEEIGSGAFRNHGFHYMKLPMSLKFIAKDAFESTLSKDPNVIVLPGSYAETWAKENKFDCFIAKPVIRDEHDEGAGGFCVNPGQTLLLRLECGEYPEIFQYITKMQWYQSTDLRKTWQAIPGATGRKIEYTVSRGQNTVFLQCVVVVNGHEITSDSTRIDLEYVNLTADMECGSVILHFGTTTTTDIRSTTYTIYCRMNGGEEQVLMKDQHQTEFTVYDLKKDVTYEFRAEATVSPYGEAEKKFTEGDTVTVTGEENPFSFTSADPAETSVTLWWSRLLDAQYTLSVTRADGTGKTVVCDATRLNCHTVTGLDPETKYTFHVTAKRNGKEVNQASASITAETLPHLDNPPESEPKYRALLVGVVDAGDGETTIRNRGDVNIMSNLLNYLVDGPKGSYSVAALIDPTSQEILSGISSVFGGADENDVSLLFIASHGDDESTGEAAGALVTHYDPSVPDSGMLYLGPLSEALNGIPGTVIVILGSCGSGAAVNDQEIPGATADQLADALLSEADLDSKFYILTAAAYHESSYSHASLEYNVFTKALADGAILDESTGYMPADSDRDGTVTLKELYAYVDKHANLYLTGGEHQTTQVFPSGSSYPLFIVKQQRDPDAVPDLPEPDFPEPGSYIIAAESGLSHVLGDGSDAVITVRQTDPEQDIYTFERFDSLLVDGKKAGKQKYTAVKGSLILTLKASYLNSLSPGEHPVKITFSDGGEVSTALIILPAPEIPKTGDSASPVLWLALTLAGIAVLFYSLGAFRPKRRNPRP